MAKLKDILPKWILREKVYGELEVGAFAHMVEDDAHEYVFIDVDSPLSGLFVGYRDGDGAADYMRNFTELDNGRLFLGHGGPGNLVLGLSVLGETQLRLAAHADGSLYWGDGTNPADISLSRDGANSNVLLDTGGAMDFFVNGGSVFAGAVDMSHYTQIDRMGAITIKSPVGQVSLGVDATNRLTVNGVAVTVP